MKTTSFILLFILLLSQSCTQKSNVYPIIPLPQKMEEKLGEFTFTENTSIAHGRDIVDVDDIVSQFNERFKTTFGFECKVNGNGQHIELISDNSQPKEGYNLSVTKNKITIKASTSQGFRYAFVTISQLLSAEFLGNTKTDVTPTIPCVEITDYPRFSYRGFHLDVARHFMNAEEVKKLIAAAALFKLNRFHWHLTDDQGWRIEIKKYPLLTEKGSIRKETIEGTWDLYYPALYDGKEYGKGCYYTQEQIKDVIKYAQDRGIMIIPEIDMPGHALAAISVYPQFACNENKTYEVSTKWGIFEDVFCPKEKTFEFVNDIVSELAELFPGDYIHLGGDECPKAAWAKCPHCQALIKKEGLKDEHELQAYFMKRCNDIVKKHGKCMIGWDELADEKIPEDAIIMAWRGSGHGALAAMEQGHDVIMTASDRLYFDYNQEDPEDAPLSIGGLIELKQVYDYNPAADFLSTEQAKHIIGVQANTWSEYIPDSEKRQYMMFPRLTALAEIAWTENDTKDWNSYAKRLNGIFKRLDAMNVNACRAFFEPAFDVSYNDELKKLEVTISTSCPNIDIYYTLDDSEPTLKSTKYIKPLLLSEGTVVKARSFQEGKHIGKTVTKKYTVNKATGKNYTASSEGYSMDWYYVPRNVINNGRYGIYPDNRGWLMFSQDSVTLIFDLEKPENISRLVIGCTRSPVNNVLGINKVICSFSSDGKNFENETELLFTYPEFSGIKEIHRKEFDVNTSNTRYVKLLFCGTEEMLNDYPYPHAKPSFAIDEIEIY